MNMNKFFKRHIFSKQYLFREKNNHKDLHRKEKSEGCAQRQKKKKSKIYYFFLWNFSEIGIKQKTENQEETETKQIKSNSKKKVLQ